ncbi:response regulator transcription factor [Ruminococcus flavefaciens]|uniref:Stage 0 sporulation protein A homolog n=1 Tax=Ruminococcus flavefaciens TaxID=1265 RepID=A0A315Y5Y4_RUMFL|nr:response regulator transcription factor [Ruminococcus flavefaciens]PWJ15398.1 DNA-binding response OmpR family regulator [Ruminococcus flavefaciens]SSA40530.1 DNA-binding response regulator, OmpR family, contains REC and winged-helix (wHTH) domain [Ruminococcus flavefaciens]
MYSILVADDEKDVVSLLKDYLELKGYCVYTANNGKEAIEQASRTPDLILLDVNMPEADGFEVCRRIRDHVSCPILFLTARIEDEDKIQGFAAGGDDYIIKPFSLEEIGARIAAHIRRDHRVNTANNVRLFGDVVVDYSNKTVSVREEALDLANKEYRIIELLSMNTGQVFDKERIYEKIWGYDAEGDSSVIAEHIRRIRAKLGRYDEDRHLATVWGMGYKWIK